MGMLPPQLLPSGALSDYDTAFQVSPIILYQGIVASVQGGLAPITTFMSGFGLDDVGNPTFRFQPLPGSTLVSQQIGMYPFANQQVAANATIQQPLAISLVLTVPVNLPGGYLSKLPAFQQLQQTLTNHNAAGGMYIVATPAYVYNFVVMTNMSDITSEGSRQQMIEWQFDFIQPILTLAAAQASYNALIQQLQNGGQFTGPPAWTGNPASTPADLAAVTAALIALGGQI